MTTFGHVPADVLQRAARVNILVLDADGVLTDGRIIYAEHGDELKCFDVQDGAGLVFWNRVGLRSAIITARTSRLLKRRAKEMRIDFLAQGKLAKLATYEQLLRKWRVRDEEVCAVGDDLMELPMLRRAGFAVTVPNGVEEVRRVSHYVTTRAGGRGAVREVIELILHAKGLWDQVLARYHVLHDV